MHKFFLILYFAVKKRKIKLEKAIGGHSVQKNFMHEVEENVLAEDEQTKTFLVPSKKEKLAIKVDKDVLTRLLDDQKLEHMLRNLLKLNSKRTTRETINITKRNYRIFI